MSNICNKRLAYKIYKCYFAGMIDIQFQSSRCLKNRFVSLIRPVCGGACQCRLGILLLCSSSVRRRLVIASRLQLLRERKAMRSIIAGQATGMTLTYQWTNYKRVCMEPDTSLAEDIPTLNEVLAHRRFHYSCRRLAEQDETRQSDHPLPTT